jgi:hypothetical protein
MDLSVLPAEIIEKIRRLTYRSQPTHLLDDIVNYHKTSNIIQGHYKQKWIIELEEHEPADLTWMLINLQIFLNENCDTLYGYKDNYINILKRLFKFKKWDKTRVGHYIFRLSHSPLKREFNLYWGAMNKDERNCFVESSIQNGILLGPEEYLPLVVR